MSKLDIAEVRIWPRTPTKKSPFTLVLAFIGHRGDLGTWHRTMAHRGVRINTVASRPMTAAEEEMEEKACRLHWMHYKGWESLIEDEWLVTENPDWIQQLITVSHSALTVEQVIINSTFPKKRQ